MVKILARLWLRRFALVFVAMSACLTVIELARQGVTASGLASVVGWSAAAALTAATIATYWAHRIQCKAVLGGPGTDSTDKPTVQ